MRSEEAATNSRDQRMSRWGRGQPDSGRGLFSLGVAVGLAGAAAAYTPAWAQDGAALIESRIEGVFRIVPGNPLDLAVPLTKRALARRMIGREALPLPYVDTEADAGSSVEEGSAEGDADDEDIARLPRPRPPLEQPSTETAAAEAELSTAAREEGMGGPLELVATAADTESEPVSPAAPTPAEGAAAAPVAVPAEPSATGSAERELVARTDCKEADALADKDGDFKRNAALLSAPGFCLTEERFRERRRSWTVQTVSSGRPGPLWAVMHDDEDLAFDFAVGALGTFGGTLVTVETGGRRNQDGIDPNRNFSDAEIGCKKLGENATPRFTATIKALIDPAQPIIAVHNNSGGDRRLGHVSMGTVPKDMRARRSADPDGPLAGERALVLLAAVEPLSDAVESRMEGLSSRGMNVVLEPIRKGQGDCSLSNYAALSGHEAYFNVTVDEDEGEKLRGMVAALLDAPAKLADSR